MSRKAELNPDGAFEAISMAYTQGGNIGPLPGAEMIKSLITMLYQAGCALTIRAESPWLAHFMNRYQLNIMQGSSVDRPDLPQSGAAGGPPVGVPQAYPPPAASPLVQTAPFAYPVPPVPPAPPAPPGIPGAAQVDETDGAPTTVMPVNPVSAGPTPGSPATVPVPGVPAYPGAGPLPQNPQIPTTLAPGGHAVAGWPMPPQAVQPPQPPQAAQPVPQAPQAPQAAPPVHPVNRGGGITQNPSGPVSAGPPLSPAQLESVQGALPPGMPPAPVAPIAPPPGN